ncbi:hypothetical protein Slu03_04630 [Sediminihabitans luteus]|nr:hypothetical protein Slu03_04630 [Sediminihabitans luteus]
MRMGTEYFYDTTTGEVTEGRQRGWRGRMGPYATRAEAEKALETADKRTSAWDEDEDFGRPADGTD